MKVIIETGIPDGLTVTFPEGNYFDTWEAAFEFIKKAIALENEINARPVLGKLREKAEVEK